MLTVAKVRPGVPAASVLQVEDDPTGKAKAMEHEWVVERKTKVNQRVPDGGIIPYAGMLIAKGDFVDVSATIDIVRTRSERGMHTRLYLELREVTLLKERAISHSVRTK